MSGPASHPDSDRRLVVWQILDDKPGHRNQTLGLTEALQSQVQLTAIPVEIGDRLRGFRSWLPGRCQSLAEYPAPDLLIAAGHATHLPLLRLKQRFGGTAIVLMKPSLPTRIFDLCFIPNTHEYPHLPRNVVLTEGALNRVRPSTDLDSQRGLILIGGPSAHYDWSDAAVLTAVAEILRRCPDKEWTIATSRRTPVEFGQEFRRLQLPGHLVEAETTSADWLPAQLSVSGTVWVTADSVSMLYEALTAGAATGLLELPGQKSTRVARSAQSLAASGRITPFSDWSSGAALVPPAQPLCESDRCASIVLERINSVLNRSARAA